MNNLTLFERGKKVLPGGVCSSTRLNQGLGHPLYLKRAEGAYLIDVSDEHYLDMSCGHGAALLGHGHPAVKKALVTAAELGVCCAADMPYHIDLAEKLCEIIPCAERIRFTNSGSEATLHALRLCRAVTGKDKILRFTGHFHGYHELTFIGGHPPKEELDRASRYRESPGIPEPMTQFIVAVPFNDLETVERVLEQQGDEIATVILEPVNFNSGGIPPQPGYLEGLRELTRKYQVLLFFDEIQTSFKKSPGGAQEDFGVTPDLCTIGKALGGGLPLSAICGPAKWMDQFKPMGEVQHSGTFNAPLPNILGGLAFHDTITASSFYPTLLARADRFYQGLTEIITRLDVPVQVPFHGARFGLIMGLDHPPTNYEDVLGHRKDLMLAFIHACYQRGVYVHDYGGAACHHGFSIAHSNTDLDLALHVFEEALNTIKDRF